jgi:3'-phosphoadenosine 5'-phosphosulfate sulfotransferase (PAPS reductase)/FAD synthetase
LANYKVTPEELKYKQGLSLQDKIDMSCERIEQWHQRYDGNIYVSFSGGRDSTVLLDVVRNRALIPDAKLVPAVFNDTGLEFPEIRDFVKTIDNVVWLKPKLTYRQVIEKYGYALISKEQSDFISDYRTTKSEKLKDIRWNGNKWGMGKISEKWKFLVNAPFKISDKCCEALKKSPAITYERKTKRMPMIGVRVDESQMRQVSYLRTGCNAYDARRPISMPIAFWTDKDILDYIEKYNLPYSKIYDMGYDRTGCMFCLFGIHRETTPNRFQKMKVTHPKIWDYCINKLGIGDVLDFIEVPYE